MIVDKIYFDMDSVLADFERGVTELCGLEPNPDQDKNPERDEAMWAGIKNVDHFYLKLKPIPGALEMFNLVYERYGDRCEILTAVPKPKRGIVDAGADKKEWVRKYLSSRIKVNIVLKEQKKDKVTGPGSILIDDMLPNIEVWQSYSGTGILHRSAEETISRLKELEIL